MFDPLTDIRFPDYKNSGTPAGFRGSSFQWAVRKLNEVDNQGIEKWVILKIPRSLAAKADMSSNILLLFPLVLPVVVFFIIITIMMLFDVVN